MNFNSIIIADGHIHIHDCFDIVTFFSSAFENVKRVAVKAGFPDKYSGILFLTESSGVNYFSKFREAALETDRIKDYPFKGFQFFLTKESNSVIVKDTSGQSIIIVAGRQIITKERLEVLGLGLLDELKDGSPITEVIKFVYNKNCIPVLPWGVGKWIGKRGKVIRKLIELGNSYFFLLGDNKNRPFFWPRSHLINIAERKGILHFPGSDPLPFKNAMKRAGSFGIWFEGTLNLEIPFMDFKEQLLENTSEINYFGKLESTCNFFRNQISIQINRKY